MPYRSTQPSNISTTRQSREVTNLLHTLRGEHFRHAQNILDRGSPSRTSRTISQHATIKHSLPISQIFGSIAEIPSISSGEGSRHPSEEPVTRTPSRGETSTDIQFEERGTPAWRERVLSLLFAQVPLREVEPYDESDVSNEHHDYEDATFGSSHKRIPPLIELCLQVLLDYCRGRHFSEILVPCLPPHLRHVLLRWTAVHSPLPSSKLFALCEPDGHVNGELIVVGPQAALPADYFASADESERTKRDVIDDEDIERPSDEESWESSGSSEEQSQPLNTLALVTTPLPATTLFSLPPTLTHLALLGLPSPTPIHRLPRVVSSEESGRFVSVQGSGRGGERMIERVEWSRWTRLKVLGLRECGIGENIVSKVNKGRWTDVEVIGVDEGILR
ncbi:unnamed protein product [Somion occarium]|uniref:Uncharacterized protein n=1 Tax=Somion occarium TaxID=3059160 RepID=A0ABP1DCB1_9APHY